MEKNWKMIRELLEEDSEVDENTYIFTEAGDKLEIMDCVTEYIEGWKNSIYQKDKKTDFSFWYGKEGEKGLKKVMEELL